MTVVIDFGNILYWVGICFVGLLTLGIVFNIWALLIGGLDWIIRADRIDRPRRRPVSVDPVMVEPWSTAQEIAAWKKFFGRLVRR